MQGILFKRRDHFKSSWRPRYFILDQGTLTYYILKNEYEYYANLRQDDLLSDDSESFSHLVGNLLGPFEELNSSQCSDKSVRSVGDQSCSLSSVMDMTANYDQQPRGILRLEGSEVAVEDGLSQGQINLFAFSITLKKDIETNQSNSSTATPKIYLAATTLDDRDRWMAALSLHSQVLTKAKAHSPHNQSISKASRNVTIPSKVEGSFDCGRSMKFFSSIFGDDIPNNKTLLTYNLLYFFPSMTWAVMRQFSINGKELVFVISLFFTLRFLFLRALGKPLPNATNYRGPVYFNFMVDLAGVLRYIKMMDEQKVNDQSSSGKISVTSIVIKAVASALEKIPGLNSKHVCYPFLAINDYFERDNLSVSYLSALSSGDESSVSMFVDHVDRLSIPEIAKKMDSLRKEPNEAVSGCENARYWKQLILGSHFKEQNEVALVIISPDSERNKIEMTASSTSNVTIVIGGVRVMKKENKKVYILSVGIAVNCVKCSVGMSRRFAELLQTFLHEPERL